MNEENKQLAVRWLGYALLAYVVYASARLLAQSQKKTQITYLVLVALLAFMVGAWWMWKHENCETCQDRWSKIKRRIGLRIIE